MSELAKAQAALKALIDAGKITVRPGEIGEFHAGGTIEEPLSEECITVVVHGQDAGLSFGEIRTRLDQADIRAPIRIVAGPKGAS